MRRDFVPGNWAPFLAHLGSRQVLGLFRVDSNFPGACSQLLKGVSCLSRSVLALGVWIQIVQVPVASCSKVCRVCHAASSTETIFWVHQVCFDMFWARFL